MSNKVLIARCLCIVWTSDKAELEPENASYHASLGVTLHKMEKYEEAEKEKRKAIELETENKKYVNHLDITRSFE